MRDKTDHDKYADDLSNIVQWTNWVESTMKRIITLYLKIPAEQVDFFEGNVLNNAVIGFAQKVKVVQAINRRAAAVKKFEQHPFSVMMTRRNAFAHQDLMTSVRLIEDKDGLPDVQLVIESMQGNGELEEITRERAFAEFFEAFMKCEKILDEMLVALGEEPRSVTSFPEKSRDTDGDVPAPRKVLGLCGCPIPAR